MIVALISGQLHLDRAILAAIHKDRQMPQVRRAARPAVPEQVSTAVPGWREPFAASAVPKLTAHRCQCAACGQFFNSVSVFEQHRRGSYSHAAPHYGRRCLATADMIARGWLKNRAGFWVTRARPVLIRTPRAGAAIALTPLGRGDFGGSPPRRARARAPANGSSDSIARFA